MGAAGFNQRPLACEAIHLGLQLLRVCRGKRPYDGPTFAVRSPRVPGDSVRFRPETDLSGPKKRRSTRPTDHRLERSLAVRRSPLGHDRRVSQALRSRASERTRAGHSMLVLSKSGAKLRGTAASPRGCRGNPPRRGRGGRSAGRFDEGRGLSAPIHAVAAARLWLWSFRRLWVAVIRRHSVRAADLPRR